MAIFTTFIIFSLLLLPPAGCFRKTKLCIKYEFISHRGTYELLAVHTGYTKARCFLACVRQPDCTAFNVLHGPGVCELLPALPDCVEPEEDDTSLYVHLTACGTESLEPFQVIKPSGLGWRWVAYNGSADRFSSDIVPASNNENHFISMNFYEGLYFTGFHAPPSITGSKSYFKLPSGQDKNCKGTNVLSIESYADHRKWELFTIGQRIPENAIVGGQLRDRSLVFVVRKVCGNGYKPGYYAPATKQAMFHCKRSRADAAISILTYVWNTVRLQTTQRVINMKLFTSSILCNLNEALASWHSRCNVSWTRVAVNPLQRNLSQKTTSWDCLKWEVISH